MKAHTSVIATKFQSVLVPVAVTCLTLPLYVLLLAVTGFVPCRGRSTCHKVYSTLANLLSKTIASRVVF